MSAPWPPLGVGIVPYVFLFVLMLVGNAYVVLRLFPKAGGRATLADATILLGILLMAMGLWFSLIYAFLDPGTASEVSVFIALNSMMGVVGCWAIALFLRAGAKPMGGPRWQWPAVFATLIVANEFLMGLAFVLGEAGPASYAAEGWSGLASLVGDSLSSPWFFWAMLANMLVLLYWLPIESPSKFALTGSAATSALGPWFVTAPLDAGLAMVALMAVLLLGTLRERRRAPLGIGYLRSLVVVWGTLAAMTVGAGAFLLEPAIGWKTFVFGLAAVAAMGGELVYLLLWGLTEAPRPALPARPGAAGSAAGSASADG